MTIKVSNLSKSFGDNQVFREFSCEIPAGEITSLEAPSGAGKTTLLRLLLGLETPDGGTIENVPKTKSVVFQEDRLLPEVSVFGNMKAVLPKSVDDSAIRDGLATLELPPNRKASELSGGMARRLSLLRALLMPGELLILDEPFNGMDADTRRMAAETIKCYRNGRTTIFVSHREEEREMLQCAYCVRLPSI